MSQREQNEAILEWIVGPTSTQARITMNGETGGLELEGVTVTVNGLPISTITFQGTWSAVVTYSTGDLVVDASGDLYISIQDGNLNNTPASSPLFWTQVIDVPDFIDVVITSSADAVVPLVAEGTATQTADLLVVRLNGGAALGGFDAAGNVFGPNITDILSATLLSETDETATFPGSSVLTAGTGITLTPGAGILTVAATGGGLPTVQQAADQGLAAAFAASSIVFPQMSANAEMWIRVSLLFTSVSNGSSISTDLSFSAAGATAPALLSTHAETGPGTIASIVGDATTVFTSGDPSVGGAIIQTIEGVILNGANANVLTIRVQRNGAAGTLKAGSMAAYLIN